MGLTVGDGVLFHCQLAKPVMQDRARTEDILPLLLSWILGLVLKLSQIFVDLSVAQAGNYRPSPSRSC